MLGISTIEKLLQFAASFTPYNQPENYTDRVRVASILGAAGVYDGAYHPATSVNLTQAATVANASITADISDPLHIRNFTNGWELSISAYQGNYGTYYSPRAYIAINGYQQQTVLQTLYPGYKNIGFSSNFELEANQSLLLTFSRKPVLKETGFWSLSIYGADQYLIKNTLSRYSISDRSTNLTFQGTNDKIYGDGANTTQDGPFQVLIQNVNVTPPANWTGNWLPGAQAFSFIGELRMSTNIWFSTDLCGSEVVCSGRCDDKWVICLPICRDDSEHPLSVHRAGRHVRSARCSFGCLTPGMLIQGSAKACRKQYDQDLV